MAEIEHFCDPADKSHPKFDSIKDVTVPLYSACGQMDGQLPEMWTFGDAVEKVRGFVHMSRFPQSWKSMKRNVN